jgi:hypothetical protein
MIQAFSGGRLLHDLRPENRAQNNLRDLQKGVLRLNLGPLDVRSNSHVGWHLFPGYAACIKPLSMAMFADLCSRHLRSPKVTDAESVVRVPCPL